MRYRTLCTNRFVSFYLRTSNQAARYNFLKRCLYQLRINFLPTMLILICCSMIALYFSELIYRARSVPTDLKPVKASHARPVKAQAQAL